MARTRLIKPGFFESDEIGFLPPFARLLFIALWQLADRQGRLEDRPARIKGFAFRFDDVTTSDVEGWLQTLSTAGFLHRYEADGLKCIEIPTFLKHQRPHANEAKSVIPARPIHPKVDQDFAPRTQVLSTKDASASLCNPSPLTLHTHTLPARAAAPVGAAVCSVPASPKKPSRKKPEVQPEDPRFATFWSQYPRPKAKRDAERAFRQQVPDDATFAALLRGLAAQAEDFGSRPLDKIPYPATWLNRREWEDAPAATTRRSPLP
ncbi:MAG: hypothetical protein JNM66_14475 [Bryobacterales bacterium]|nr:hypothetical protein [Bryobacterales bacterium]